MQEDSLRKGLLESLNSNGFSFQYAAIQEINRLRSEHQSSFFPIVSEFPVTVKGRTTHIDIVLKHDQCPFYLVLECKRADPARANWCFVKAPYVSSIIFANGFASGERIVREVVTPNSSQGGRNRISLDWISREKDIYRLAFELKSAGKGDGKSRSGRVNDAVTQVLRGMNGLIALAATDLHSSIFLTPDTTPFSQFNDHRYAAFMPVVLTTAKLWISNADLAQATLHDGNLTKEHIDLEERPWLYFQYPQSPDLKHDNALEPEVGKLADLLYREYTRTICIVNTEGMSEFFKRWRHCEDWKSE